MERPYIVLSASVKSERLIDIGAAAPASYPLARAQKVR
jgi:hypothetical protein